MTSIVGEWSEAGPPAIMGMQVSLRALDLVVHWKRCGLTADWFAAFFVYDFPVEDRPAATSVLSTAINELIENAVKFCSDKTQPVSIAIRHHGDFVRLETINRVDAVRADKLRLAIDEIITSDLGVLFARRIEHQAEAGASGLGLLILKKDYNAKIGLKLVPVGGELDVHVQVTLQVEEVSGR